jgi:hypothetical protein
MQFRDFPETFEAAQKVWPSLSFWMVVKFLRDQSTVQSCIKSSFCIKWDTSENLTLRLRTNISVNNHQIEIQSKESHNDWKWEW